MTSFTFDPLTPAAFLRRSASTFPDRVAVVDGERRWTYREFADRCDGLRGALALLGVGVGERVAALCVNSHVMLELHHAVPAYGAVLVPVNVRLRVTHLYGLTETFGAAELAAHVRARLAGFKVPRSFVFGPLPKTSTGKLQKNVLRTLAGERDRSATE
jgi:fatty-acyl-CoA synthase